MLYVLRFWFARISRFMPQVSARLLVRLFLTPSRYPVQSETGRELLKSAQRHKITIGAATAVAWRWRNAGRRVLVLHGWSDRAANLGDVISRLLVEGYDVTAMDMPAHGESPGNRTHMRDWQCVLRAMETEDGAWHAIVAHSLGAFVASALTRDDLPQYGHGVQTKRLVLFAPPNGSIDMLNIFCDVLRVPIAIRERALHLLDNVIHADFAAFSTAKALVGFSGEALVIYDRDDQRVPLSQFEAIRRHAPMHYYLVTQGLGHRRLLSDPGTLDCVAEFIAQGVVDVDVDERTVAG